MTNVGIDITKCAHVAAVEDSSDHNLLQAFTFKNDAQGLCFLQTQLDALPKDQMQIGLDLPRITLRTSSAIS